MDVFLIRYLFYFVYLVDTRVRNRIPFLFYFICVYYAYRSERSRNTKENLLFGRDRSCVVFCKRKHHLDSVRFTTRLQRELEFGNSIFSFIESTLPHSVISYSKAPNWSVSYLKRKRKRILNI